MRALTISQPWASLVALGAKTIETRSWWTGYRGEVLIHAAKAFPPDCQGLCHRDPFLEALLEGDYRRAEALPRGVVLAVAVLERVVPSAEMDPVWAAATTRPDGCRWVAREQAFGDYGPNRFAWFLRDVRPLPTPLPVKGALGLWTVTQTLLDLVAGQGVAEAARSAGGR